ncbi:MAG: M43 family zinc metalloprotease [Saprospiraceae bacterium]
MRHTLHSCSLLSLLVFSLHLYGQNAAPACGTDLLRQQLAQENPGYLAAQAEADRFYLEYLEQTAHTAQRPLSVVTVPIVIHVVHTPGIPIGTAENLSDADVLAGLDLLNQAFAGVSCNSNPDGNPVGIQFALAQRDAKGNPTSGITRHASTATTVYPGGWSNVMLITALDGKFPTTDYVNVWLVKEFCYFSQNGQCHGPQGVSTLAGSHGHILDGSIIEAGAWFNPLSPCNSAKISAHELGHYFNLLHTFEGGCPNDNCHLQGDQVCDTPPDVDESVGNTCVFANSCSTDADDDIYFNPFLDDQPDPEENYMDYSNAVCQYRFTPGQVQRMLSALYGPRKSLLASEGLQPACLPVMSLNFAAPTAAMINVPQTFQATVANADSIAWLVDGQWVSDADTLVTTFTNPGDHSVTLTVVNNSGCSRTLTKSFKVYHANCPNNIVLPYVQDICPNGTVELYAYPPGGIWSAEDFLFTGTVSTTWFELPGPHTVTYSVIDGLCRQSASMQLNISDIELDVFAYEPIDCANPHPVQLSIYSNADFVNWVDPLGNPGFYNPFGGMPTASVAGTYHFFAMDGPNTCQADYYVNSTDPAEFSIENCTVCPANSIQLCAEGLAPGSTVKWSNYSSVISGGPQVSVNQAGYWVATAITPSGCESSALYYIPSMSNLNPVCNAGASAPLPCFTSGHLLGVSSQGGSLAINWATQDGHIVSGGNTMTPEFDRPGTYQLIVTNTASGCTGTDYTHVSRYVPVVQDYQTICAGDNYLGHTQTGEYTDTVHFARSCDSVLVLHLTVLPAITQTIFVTVCAGQSYEGYTETGVYTDVFTASNGCDSLRTLNLFVAPEPVLDNAQITADNGLGTGAISVDIQGGTFQYLWSNGATGAFIDNLIAGVYQLTLTDATACTRVFEFEVPLSVGTQLAPGGPWAVLSPNPATPGEAVRLEIVGLEAAGGLQVSVFDPAGRQIGQYAALPSGNRATAGFSLPEAGWYLVRLEGKEGWQSVFRIVCVAAR